MFQIEGKHNIATVYGNADTTTISQIIELCNQEALSDSKIKIMPDNHAGKGCVIGTTMTITNAVVPNLVGVDVGCGMSVRIYEKDSTLMNFKLLDETIHKYIPSGFNVRKDIAEKMDTVLESLNDMTFKPNNIERIKRSIGTLGGGNHFIEVNEDDNFYYLVVHSGSRNLGKQVADHHQAIAKKSLDNSIEIKALITSLRKQGRQLEINFEIKKVRNKRPRASRDLEYLTGRCMDDYLHDMVIAQRYAMSNRAVMLDTIEEHMEWIPVDSFVTVHNYIDTNEMILRKGAISAQVDERVIIPLNMRDGSIIAFGKGNPDWNFSAPHGAGRLMSRSQAKREIKMEDYKETMSDVWTTSVTPETLDEAPMAYKNAQSIIDVVGETLYGIRVIKPIYNFKNSTKKRRNNHANNCPN